MSCLFFDDVKNAGCLRGAIAAEEDLRPTDNHVAGNGLHTRARESGHSHVAHIDHDRYVRNDHTDRDHHVSRNARDHGRSDRSGPHLASDQGYNFYCHGGARDRPDRTHGLGHLERPMSELTKGHEINSR